MLQSPKFGRSTQAVITWICVIQFAFICGVEAVFVSVFTGSPQFDYHYGYPGPGTVGLMIALYPVFAGIGSLSTMLLSCILVGKRALQLGTIIWLGGFMLGIFRLSQEGIIIARALKGFAIGIITSSLAPYIESVGDIVDPSKVLTAFQGIVPFALLCKSLIAFFLHHHTHHANFNICWVIAGSPAMLSIVTCSLLPQKIESKETSLGLLAQLRMIKGDRAAKGVIKAIIVQICVQLTGINVVLYYIGNLCLIMGFSRERAQYVSMGLYACNFLATCCAIPFINKLPHLRVLRLSALVMAMCHGAMFVFAKVNESRPSTVVGCICIAACFVFMAIFSMFFNGISFVYTSSLVPLQYKSLGVGVAIGVGWFVNAVLSALMPIVMARLSGTTFMIFNWFCSIIYTGLR